jgi:hypothetical protein
MQWYRPDVTCLGVLTEKLCERYMLTTFNLRLSAFKHEFRPSATTAYTLMPRRSPGSKPQPLGVYLIGTFYVLDATFIGISPNKLILHGHVPNSL